MCKVNDDVWQEIVCWIVDLVHELFAHCGLRDVASCSWWLGNYELAVGEAFSDRKTAVGPPSLLREHPISKVTAGCVAATFNHMSSNTAGCKEIIVSAGPLEFVDKWA